MFATLALTMSLLTHTEAIDVKVMTYNLRYGTANDGENSWQFRRAALLERIKSHTPELLGVQEALTHQIEEIIAEMPEYAVYGVGRDDGISKGEYSAVLYKKNSFGLNEAGTRWISNEPTVIGSKGPGANLPRIFTWCVFNHSSGRQFLFVNSHFDHQSAAARLLGATQIADFTKSLSKYPAIVTGDFNCSFDDEPVKHFLSSGFSLCKPEQGPWGSFTGFDVKNINGSMIDHILHDSRWSLKSVEIDRTLYKSESGKDQAPSDHFPVVATLTLN